MRFDGCRRNGRSWGGALCTLVGILLLGASTEAGGPSASKVKVSATAGKIDATGKQIVTVTLVIDKTWHVYANPVKCEDVESIQTTIKVNAGVKLAKVDVKYPAGKVYIDNRFPTLKPMVYEEKIDIPVVVQRAAGDVSPLDLEVFFCACDANNCLLPSTKKIPVK